MFFRLSSGMSCPLVAVWPPGMAMGVPVEHMQPSWERRDCALHHRTDHDPPWLCFAAGKGQRLWGHPTWRTHVPGLLMWAGINAGLWVCFAWWLAGYTKIVWIIGASSYAGMLLLHFLLSLRPGCAAALHAPGPHLTPPLDGSIQRYCSCSMGEMELQHENAPWCSIFTNQRPLRILLIDSRAQQRITGLSRSIITK